MSILNRKKKDEQNAAPADEAKENAPSVEEKASAVNEEVKQAPKKETKGRGRLDPLIKSIQPRVREFRVSMKLLSKSFLAMLGLIIVITMVIIALLAPLLAPPPPEWRDTSIVPKYFNQGISPPGSTYFDPVHNRTVDFILGSGEDGSDIYYGVIWGAQTSIRLALVVVLSAVVMGIIVGAVAGYYGGKIDELMMRVTDVFLSIPGLVLAMAVIAVLKPTIDNIMISLVIVWWPSYARLIRGQVMTIKENTYVEAARAIGAKKNRILFRHIIPNAISPMLVSATMDIGSIVLTTAGLSYIGFGPPGVAEWGRMANEGAGYIVGFISYQGVSYNPYWIIFFPGMMIFLFVMGFNLLGDGLRDILDPRLRR
ncbi:MAG: D-ala-D-ala transporter subunit [Methanomassiliicoccales archaeon PtaU1.Bin124]|nr:MAG: D-ala-D-ala transporter subunit [Methanomassiliicoccales archaeon PtaU1.Bin124]